MLKIVALLILLVLLFAPIASAQTPTKTDDEIASPTEEARTNTLTDQINDLKNKIASRVAELDLVDKRGVTGTVKEVKSTQITLVDQQQKTRIVDVDGITKFSSPSAKNTFGLSDLKKGTTINVIGLYNKQSRRILARFVDVTTLPKFVSGVVTEVDPRGFTFTVLDSDTLTTTVDVENITRTNLYSADGDITRAGFSRVNVGNRVIITGYQNANDPERLTGLRILLLPDAPENPQISFSSPETNTTPTLSPSGTGKRATPTPTDDE